jgi:hypothetical protein
MVEEAPGADHALLAAGQRAANQHAAAEIGAAAGDAKYGGHGVSGGWSGAEPAYLLFCTVV